VELGVFLNYVGKNRAPTPGGARRPPSLALGVAAESRVLERLVSEGWELLDRNWRCKAGELDLVVAKGETLAFVEVKALEDVDGPDDWQPEVAVAPAKRQKLARAARLWLITNEARAQGLFPRFDVVTVAGSGEGARIEHLVDAFESPGG
jgi:putative endonuclease